jgi:hypothetical protein
MYGTHFAYTYMVITDTERNKAMAYESNPLKAKVRDIAFKTFTNGTPLEAAEYEATEIGKWELQIRVKPEDDSAPRYFKLKLSEAL